ncbi:hypothetical protein CROQUDRAFT_665239 [Cronartium quercuum f. sp. fusiforme G11]|uniref:Uncharacterized protein n=1 Tax=Cronartium quercuum f. sp. fusiforme G11 TaxID=708437 RepID=A0A9P6N6D9_9BASI|nr:hypothetical protein CROQUDRAFT_665239 [Cronartium quercuum f. sp. fusiforme G11]
MNLLLLLSLHTCKPSKPTHLFPSQPHMTHLFPSLTDHTIDDDFIWLRCLWMV